MALETGNYIADLVAANPTGTDPKSSMDDHLRLLKNVLKRSFPGFSGSVLLGGVDTGAADAYVLTPVTALTAYTAGLQVLFKPTNANATTTPTLNVSGLGAKTIKAVDGSALVAGDLVANRYLIAAYDGTAFCLLQPTKGYIDRADTALRTYIDQLVFSAALPNQAGKAGSVIRTDGTSASWGTVLPTVLKFTSSTTWVATATTVRLTLSGGGGSSAVDAVSTNIAVGGAGAGTGIKTLTGLTIGATYTLAIGAGGAAVSIASGTSNGNAGGTTSFSGPGITTVSATGGSGGIFGSGCTGGTATNCDVVIPGGSTIAGNNPPRGGSSFFAAGAINEQSGVGYGEGAGPKSGVAGPNTGNAGGPGVLILEC